MTIKQLLTLCKGLLPMILALMSSTVVMAQDSTTIQNISIKKLTAIEKTADSYNDKIDKQTAKYLRKIEKQEQRLKRKIQRLDSTAAKELFDQSTQQYTALKNKLADKQNQLATHKYTQYFAGLDSTITGLSFIKDNELLNNTKGIADKLTGSLEQYKVLQNKLEVTKEITDYLKQRKQLLQQTLEKYSVGKYLKKYNKQAYYYTAQLNEYKEALKDPAKAERLILKALNTIPKFQEFFAQFSQIGQLFPAPQAGAGGIANLAGLQTRAQVMNQIQTSLGGTGNGPNNILETLQQNMQDAQTQLSSIKEKILNNTGKGDAEFDMPNFKPNNQKSKNFLKRFELKTDVQTNKGSNILPNAADIAIGAGYKIDDKKIAGVQVAYKLGLGNGLNNIKFTTEGISYRSYVDFKFPSFGGARGGLWLSGGYELTNFTRDLTQWREAGSEARTKSALLGLSKKYSLSKKRKGEAKLLYNFLWQQQPNAQRIIFRTGLNF
jgi:hypothetical protein